MEIGRIVRFHDEHFFEGAVQLGWFQRRPEQARKAAGAFVFHGPRYHGAGEAEQEGIDRHYRLKDTASFLHDLLASLQPAGAAPERNPYWLVVSSYGTGKSHLGVTCATLLADPRGETAPAIVAQLERADADIGAAVSRQVATMVKPVLVLALDGMAGFHLGNALSRAVFAQLERHGVDAGAIRALSPRFETAAQFVSRNFDSRAARFAAHPDLGGLDRDAIRALLGERDEKIYTAVDALYTEANGHPIPIEGQESAQDLIETLCTQYCGPNGPFSHVAILFDELGRYLEYAAEKPRLAGDAVLQQIFQGVQDHGDRVRFIGFIQYDLRTYLTRFNSPDLRQLQRYVTRFDAADKWYLSTNLETIFAHMIGKDEAALAELWRSTQAEQRLRATWQTLSGCLPEFARFPVWRDPERFARIVGQGCWPLHPLAVWFLARLKDLVQSRSALTFIKDIIERLAEEAVETAGRLRQVGVAELVLGSMLQELIAAERQFGGSTIETLQMLLERLSGHLDRRQQWILAGVAALEKTRVGKQSREMANRLLAEATTLDPDALPGMLATLAELGALEWNADLGQYELLTDGASRGQFQQWLRHRQAGLKADELRDLFARLGASECGLGEIKPDFDQSRMIATPDWFFAARLTQADRIENVIQAAFQEWRQATLPKDAKGQAIYLYAHPDDDLAALTERVGHCLALELNRSGLDQAPIWIMGLVDRRSLMAEHMGRLYLFDERLSAADRERFRRFLPDERERSRLALIEATRDALKERIDWIAGFPQTPAGRLPNVARSIFEQVYPRTIPFPFDGFASAAGGGAGDAAQLARALMARQVSGSWVQAQPIRLQNRVDAVLMRAWQALGKSGKLGPPTEPRVAALYGWLEQAHREDADRTLLVSYRALLAPPHGLNSASANLLLGLLIGLDTPPRRLELSGTLVSAADWLGEALPGQRGRHHPEEAVLAKTRLRFLDEDSESRWRGLLNRWEAEQNYDAVLALADEAERMRAIDPLPEVLEGNYKYLRDLAEQIRHEWLELRNKFDQWERELEQAAQRSSVKHALKWGREALRQRDRLQDNPHWPADRVQRCNGLIALAQGAIRAGIADWIPRQICREATQVNEFREESERAAKTLAALGFAPESRALTQQAQQSILRVEKLQQFSLTLAQCADYPRQPEPTDSTQVRTLRDEIARGEALIQAVQAAASALTPAEIAAQVGAIRQRQQRLQAAIKRQQEALGAIYGLTLDRQEAVTNALTRARRLREIFIDTPDAEEVTAILTLLERLLADLDAWEAGERPVERLGEILSQQSAHQLAALRTFLEEREIEPPWPMEPVYQALVEERLAAARRRSAEWLAPRLSAMERIERLDDATCQALERELAAAPGHLAAADAVQAEALLTRLRERRAFLDEQERQRRVAEWQRPYWAVTDVETLDRLEIERLLHGLRHPPGELSSTEQAQMASIESRLTARLDQISLDELWSRIERISAFQQRQLLERLSECLSRTV